MGGGIARPTPLAKSIYDNRVGSIKTSTRSVSKKNKRVGWNKWAGCKSQFFYMIKALKYYYGTIESTKSRTENLSSPVHKRDKTFLHQRFC